MPDHDVVVVGAGPVGLLLGCLLAQRGIDVVVCERRADADTRSRAIGIHTPGLAALDAAGLGERVRAEALALTGGEVRSRGRTLAAVDFGSDRTVLVLAQRRTDALLRERLEQLTRGSLRASHVVHRIRDEGGFVRVAVDGGHGMRELTASVAVAADGAHSRLREQLGIAWRPRAGRGRYAMLDVPDGAGGARAVLHCGPEGLVESFPMPGALRRWVVWEGADRFTTAEAFGAEIEARTGIRPTLPPDAVPSSFHASQHLASAFAVGRIALVGDAAHEVSPIGGQGMNLGWTAAERLAADIVRGLDRGRVDLRRYRRRSTASARAAQQRAAFYMSMGVPATGLALGARELLIRSLGSPLLRGWTAGLITMRGL